MSTISNISSGGDRAAPPRLDTLPFFDEDGPLISVPSENAEALRWHKTLARYDGFVFVVAEYNNSITGMLKNALDQAYEEWGRKGPRNDGGEGR